MVPGQWSVEHSMIMDPITLHNMAKCSVGRSQDDCELSSNTTVQYEFGERRSIVQPIRK